LREVDPALRLGNVDRVAPLSSRNGTSRVLSRLIGSLSLLVAIFSPIEISQFQCCSPTEFFQFHCQLAGALLLGGGVHASS
jgi:hypothetical protein